MTKKAKLEYDNTTYEMPIVEGTYAERGVDIRSLRKDTGLITLDSGFMNTGATTSEITYISGEEGILLYRGYPIEQLAEKSSFIETSYLLIYGELPTTSQLEQLGVDERLVETAEVLDQLQSEIDRLEPLLVAQTEAQS